MTNNFPADAPGLWIEQMMQDAGSILDAGCGPNGSYWWKQKPEEARMLALDLYHPPSKLPANTTVRQQDILDYAHEPGTAGTFDRIVADHILEHISRPLDVVLGFNHLLRTGGLLHVGVPDCNQFTDRFYRLIHAGGGGHVSRFTRDSLVALMAEAGFTCRAIRPWPDNWEWLRSQFDWQKRRIKLTSQEDIQAIAEVLQRELTLEKGYFYGWEAVFEKTAGRPLPPLPPGSRAEPIPEEEDAELQRLYRLARLARYSKLYAAVRGVYRFVLRRKPNPPAGSR